MSMAEIAYQMCESVQFMVGSEETEPVDGWPYDLILSQLSNNIDMTARDLKLTVVKKYIESYKGTGNAVTRSACDLTASKNFANAAKVFAEALIKGLAEARTLALITKVRNRVQEYQVNDNVDLVNFCQLLKNSNIPETLRSSCSEVISVVRDSSGLVVNSGYNGGVMKQSNGVA